MNMPRDFNDSPALARVADRLG